MFRSMFNVAMLAVESQQVVGLRLLKLGGGGSSAGREAVLMVTEKMEAASRATQSLFMGASPDSVVSGYRTKVQANARRLLGS